MMTFTVKLPLCVLAVLLLLLFVHGAESFSAASAVPDEELPPNHRELWRAGRGEYYRPGHHDRFDWKNRHRGGGYKPRGPYHHRRPHPYKPNRGHYGRDPYYYKPYHDNRPPYGHGRHRGRNKPFRGWHKPYSPYSPPDHHGYYHGYYGRKPDLPSPSPPASKPGPSPRSKPSPSPPPSKPRKPWYLRGLKDDAASDVTDQEEAREHAEEILPNEMTRRNLV